MRIAPICLIAIGLMLCEHVSAAAIEAGGLGGLMQQPGSSYYLAVSGGYVSFATDSQKVLGNIGYVQRPEFHSQGYTDQDYAAYAMMGTKLTKATWHGLYAYAGLGQQGGYIKSDPARAKPGESTESHYAMRGMVASLEYGATLGNFTASLSHMTFIGYGDQDQFDAKVVWPVNFFFAKAGLRF